MKRAMVSIAAGALSAAAPAPARPVYSAAGPVPIPDAGPGGCLSSPLTGAGTLDVLVPESFTISAVKVGIHVVHSYQGDLEFTIEKVGSGAPVTLVHLPASPQLECGYSAHDFGGAPAGPFVLDDNAPFTYDLPGIPVPGINFVSGTWKPESPLAAFNGLDSQGTWRFTAVDHTNLDSGMIMFVQLTIDGACYPDCNGVGGLTIADFGCFQTRFVAGDPYADCNGVGGLTIADFACFQTKFVARCP